MHWLSGQSGRHQIVRQVDIWATYYALDAHISELRDNTSDTLKKLNDLLEEVKRWESEYKKARTLGERQDIVFKEAGAVRDVAGDVVKLIGGYKGLLDAIESNQEIFARLRDDVRSLRNLKEVNEADLAPLFNQMETIQQKFVEKEKRGAYYREIRGLLAGFVLAILAGIIVLYITQ